MEVSASGQVYVSDLETGPVHRFGPAGGGEVFAELAGQAPYGLALIE